jgi:hypothetical protein
MAGFKLTKHQSKIKTLRPGESGWMLDDGVVVCPRAGFEISRSCPTEYVTLLKQAINAGWIKPVAHLYGKELTLDLLRK